MKISELNTNTYLNNDGAPENSYLLINYAAGQGMSASTQKVSLDTVAKAVAAKLNLPIAVTDNQDNVTGFQRVRANGNQYQIENLNAQLGGGGGSSVGVGPVTADIMISDNTSHTGLAYPLFYVPTVESVPTEDPTEINESVQGVIVALTESNGSYYTINSSSGCAWVPKLQWISDSE